MAAKVPATVRLLDGVQQTGPSATVELLGWEKILLQIWGTDGGTGGATATIQIEAKNCDADAPWFPCATITNPTGGDGSGGELWMIPALGMIRVNVLTYDAGFVYASIARATLGRI